MKWLNKTVSWVRAGDPSPHHSSRGGQKIDAALLHYTAGGKPRAAVRWFAHEQSRTSAHFVVGRVSSAFQCVPLDRRAWHAGRGAFPYEGKLRSSRIDRCMVGIEIANHGLLQWDEDEDRFYYHVGRSEMAYDVDKYGEPELAELSFKSGHAVAGFWAPYPDKQVQLVAKLCAEMVAEFDIPIHRIVGHEDVATPVGRKIDPGPLWPWKRFIESLCGELRMSVPNDVWDLHKTV